MLYATTPIRLSGMFCGPTWTCFKLQPSGLCASTVCPRFCPALTPSTHKNDNVFQVADIIPTLHDSSQLKSNFPWQGHHVAPLGGRWRRPGCTEPGSDVFPLSLCLCQGQNDEAPCLCYYTWEPGAPPCLWLSLSATYSMQKPQLWAWWWTLLWKKPSSSNSKSDLII